MYTIKIETGRVKYHLDLTHRVSIVRGDSGTGKSWMCELVETKPEGLIINSQLNLVAPPVDLVVTVGAYTDAARSSILFLDEDNPWLHNKEFIRAIVHKQIWCVVCTRSLKGTLLPVDVSAIYSLKTVGNIRTLQPYYNKLRNHNFPKAYARSQVSSK